jgi:hypothetical protein
MTSRPNWYYDELQHIGVDFDNPEQVETYTQKQGTTAFEEFATYLAVKE